MTAIYFILLASYTFRITTSLSSDFEKADFYRGLLFVISFVLAIASVVLVIIDI